MRFTSLILLLMLFEIFSAFLSKPADAQVVILATRDGGRIGGLDFSNGDLVRYNMQTDEAEIFLPASTFDAIPGRQLSIDAFSASPNDDSFLFSSRRGLIVNAQTVTNINGFTVETTGGTQFTQLELIRSDGVDTNNVEVVFRNFSTDVSGAAVLPNGNLLLAGKVNGAFRDIDGIDHRVGDIVEYNPETGVGSIFFSADNFFTIEEGGVRAVGNIDAIDYLANGNLLLSVTNNADIGTSLDDIFTLEQGGVYEYDFSTGEVSTFFDPELFDNSAVDLKAFSVIDSAPSVLIGDVDFSGVVDFGDISPFIQLISDRGYQAEADTNNDGVVDFFDISEFIAILSL